MQINDDFINSLDPYWSIRCTGGGTVQASASKLRMAFESARKEKYTDAQIDDYHTTLLRTEFVWKPPLRMTVRARTSHHAVTSEITNNKNILKGTAGFGFWNKPSLKRGIFTLPEAIWFFYASPPSNMALVPGMPGYGWKAQVVHAMRPGTLPYIIPLSLTSAYGRLTGNINPAAYWMQRLTGTSEAILPTEMTKWHTYTLEWKQKQSLFWVDDKLVFQTASSPTHALGFVAWIDNAYSIATPKGELKFGSMAINQPEWIEMDSVEIKQL